MKTTVLSFVLSLGILTAVLCAEVSPGSKQPPILGDNDKVVPLNANSGELVKRYKALGGTAELEVIPGGGHDMNPAWFQSQPLTDFIITHALHATGN